MTNAKSLKDANRISLYGLVILNAVLFVGIVQSGSLLAGTFTISWSSLTGALPAGAIAALVGLLNAQVSALNKARLVFGRWRHPLPGSEAFTKHLRADPRIRAERLEQLFGPLPSDPQDQNSLWYEFLKSVETEPAVWQAHREFLFARDYSFLSLLMLLTFGTGGFFLISTLQVSLIYAALLVLQSLLTIRAARSYGRRLVTSVLALKAAGK